MKLIITFVFILLFEVTASAAPQMIIDLSETMSFPASINNCLGISARLFSRTVSPIKTRSCAFEIITWHQYRGDTLFPSLLSKLTFNLSKKRREERELARKTVSTPEVKYCSEGNHLSLATILDREGSFSSKLSFLSARLTVATSR